MTRWLGRIVALILLFTLMLAPFEALAANKSRDNKITKEDVRTPAWVYTYVLTVYDKPTKNSEVLEEVPYAKTITKLRESSGWAKVITTNEVIGFCNAKQLTETDPNTLNKKMYCQQYETEIYLRPSADAPVMGYVHRNERLKVVAMTPRADWLRFEMDDFYYYIPRPCLDDEKYAREEDEIALAWVARDELDVYYEEDLDSKIGTCKFGQEVTLLKKHQGNRAKIRSKTGLIAYCDIEGLTFQNPTSLNITCYTQVAGNYLFNSPNDSSGHRSVESNVEMVIDAVDNRRFWARVRYQDQYYYVPVVFLDDSRLKSGNFKIVHTTQAVHIKSGTKQSSSIVATVPKDTLLLLVGATDLHARVATPPDENGLQVTGYVEIDYLK